MNDQMDYLAVAPENSFIDARKFKSPQDLANYLIYLDRNDDEYLKYFEWKDKYQVVYGQSGLGCVTCVKKLMTRFKGRRNTCGIIHLF